VKTSAALVKLIIFMIVTSILTVFLAATIGNITIGGKKTYSALFSDVTGLLSGNDIRIAGVKVGQVDSIELYERTLAKVTFSVEEQHPVAKSAVLRLRYRNLVGERYVAITEGPGSSDPAPEGTTLPLAQTRNALDLTVLFNGFRPLFQALDPQSTNEVAFELVQTLQGEGGTLESLMQRTASLTNTLADRDAVIGRVIINLSTVLDTLDDGDQLSQLILQLRRLSAGFAQDRVEIGRSIVGINALTTATTGFLQEVRPGLRADIRELGTLAATLDTNKSTVDGVLRRLPTKLDRIIGTATYGSWFNFYLCGFDGRIVLASGQVLSPQFVNTAARCQRGAGE